MRIARTGLSPVKGGRHTDRPSVQLALDGPVGDRVFCLVDRACGRVLRTVENPTLPQTAARWRDGVLSVTLPSIPGGAVSGEPVPTGETVKVDYWGRVAALEVVEGPWAQAYSEHVGYDVVLARATRPGEVVYGASVTLVTSSSLDLLAERTGGPVDGARFRATLTVDTTGHPPHVEDDWVGRRLRLGDAEVEVRGGVPRCAVVDLDPVSGSRRSPVLRSLGRYRRHAGEVVFGVDAVVTSSGGVDVGAPCERG